MRQRAQIALGRQPIGGNSMLARRNRRPREPGVASEEPLDLLQALLGLERARAVDEHAARRHEASGVVQQTRLHLRQGDDVFGALQPQDIGMAADGAG